MADRLLLHLHLTQLALAESAVEIERIHALEEFIRAIKPAQNAEITSRNSSRCIPAPIARLKFRINQNDITMCPTNTLQTDPAIPGFSGQEKLKPALSRASRLICG